MTDAEDLAELSTRMGSAAAVLGAPGQDSQLSIVPYRSSGGVSIVSKLGMRMNAITDMVKGICGRVATDTWPDNLKESTFTKPLNMLVGLESEAAHVGDEAMLASTRAFTSGCRYGKVFHEMLSSLQQVPTTNMPSCCWCVTISMAL